jgi:protease-4
MPDPIPVPTPPPPPRRPSRLAGVLFGMSLMLNVLVFLAAALVCGGAWMLGRGTPQTTPSLSERYHSGKKSATDKIAIVRLEGVIMEGLNGFTERQIDEAAEDGQVKAVVLRINSPGGSVTESDELHRRLTRLRDGVAEKGTAAKPLVVSMAGMAASGGYYVAMPAQSVYAEPTTMTGSIGVFGSFPEVTGLSDKIGVDMTIVKRGAVKASGNPFRKMTDEEYAVWDDMIGHAYDRFLDVVKHGRGDNLKAPLTANVISEDREVTFYPKDPKTQEPTVQKKKVHYTRQLADGGVWTSDEALKFGLIDEIGYLDDAVKHASDLAKLGDDWKAVTYEHPSLLMRLLEEGEIRQPAPLDPAKLAEAATPRLWYLAPQSELAGVLKAAGQ